MGLIALVRHVAPASEFRTGTIEDDIGDPHLNDRIAVLNGLAAPLAFEPALVAHNLRHLGQFFSDELGLGIHRF